jgi:hypothetical protein
MLIGIPLLALFVVWAKRQPPRPRKPKPQPRASAQPNDHTGFPRWFWQLCIVALVLNVVLVAWLGIGMIGLAIWVALGLAVLAIVLSDIAHTTQIGGPGPAAWEVQKEQRAEQRHQELLQAIH